MLQFAIALGALEERRIEDAFGGSFRCGIPIGCTRL